MLFFFKCMFPDFSDGNVGCCWGIEGLELQLLVVSYIIWDQGSIKGCLKKCHDHSMSLVTDTCIFAGYILPTFQHIPVRI